MVDSCSLDQVISMLCSETSWSLNVPPRSTHNLLATPRSRGLATVNKIRFIAINPSQNMIYSISDLLCKSVCVCVCPYSCNKATAELYRSGDLYKS